jgi:hypothetical protein
VILQRFDGARLGSFEDSPESGSHKETVEEVAFVLYPGEEVIRVGRKFAGRETCFFWGRKRQVLLTLLPDDVDKIREGNDHVLSLRSTGQMTPR